MLAKKRIILAVLLVLVTLLATGCSNNNTVGLVDINKVMTESAQVKQFQEQFNTKVKALNDKLEAEKAGISEEEYEKRRDSSYADLLKDKQQLESQMDAALKQAIEQVAQAKKLSIVIYKNAVAHGGIDITDDIIQKMQ